MNYFIPLSGMKRIFLLVWGLGLLGLGAGVAAQEWGSVAPRFEGLEPGQVVAEEQLQGLEVERCFYAEPLSDAVFQRMVGCSYRAGAPVSREELRYLRLLHCDAEGQTRVGELVCHQTIADSLLAIFRALYEAGYPIERMQLIDDFEADDNRSMEANNSSSFNFRPMVGSSKLSKHSYGLAIDINPLYNPYVKRTAERLIVEPASAAPYVERTREFPYKLTADDLCVRLFKAHGFTWGGDWRSLKDYQHFEK